jgi:hypothetical protein
MLGAVPALAPPEVWADGPGRAAANAAPVTRAVVSAPGIAGEATVAAAAAAGVAAIAEAWAAGVAAVAGAWVAGVAAVAGA